MEPVELASITPHPVEKPWALTGTNMEREHNIVNSLYLKPDVLEKKNFERFERYAKIEQEEVRFEEFMMDDAEYVLVAFGIASRVTKNAVTALREMGIKAGLIRPITLWPFPKEAIKKAADKAKAFVSVELSMGQMIEDVTLAEESKKPVYLCNRCGGMIPSADMVIDFVKNLEGGQN